MRWTPGTDSDVMDMVKQRSRNNVPVSTNRRRRMMNLHTYKNAKMLYLYFVARNIGNAIDMMKKKWSKSLVPVIYEKFRRCLITDN